MRHARRRRLWAALSLAVVVAACGSGPAPAEQPGAPAEPAGTAALTVMPEERLWTGDLDVMVKRRVIRAGVPYSKTHYFLDNGVPRGGTYDGLKLFEEELNTSLRTGSMGVHVVFVVMSRDELLPAVVDGRVDLAAASLTVTPERQALVDFSHPTMTDVDEIVVTAPGGPAVTSVTDLAGLEVFVRKSSSYYQSLVTLNERLKVQGKRAVVIKEAPEVFEDEDILEMVNAGLVKTAVVDNYKAAFWKQVFPDITLHPGAAVRTGGTIAVAMRKRSPKLMAAANAWIAKHGPRTTFGNETFRKYLQNTQYVKSATNQREMQRFQALSALFRKYGEQYNVDYLLMIAQGYQESRLDHTAKSRAGAIGVMQVMPSTGRELKVGDITKVEPNIHAGVKYIRFMIDQYFADEPMTPLNKGLFAFAAYNAGPSRVAQLRKTAAERGLDPNVWFNNVERIAAERVGRETVQYVSNIFKYYIAYRLAMEQLEAKKAARTGPVK